MAKRLPWETNSKWVKGAPDAQWEDAKEQLRLASAEYRRHSNRIGWRTLREFGVDKHLYFGNGYYLVLGAELKENGGILLYMWPCKMNGERDRRYMTTKAEYLATSMVPAINTTRGLIPVTHAPADWVLRHEEKIRKTLGRNGDLPGEREGGG